MKETRAEHLAVEKLRPFDGHPFKVVDNEEMDQLVAFLEEIGLDGGMAEKLAMNWIEYKMGLIKSMG